MVKKRAELSGLSTFLRFSTEMILKSPISEGELDQSQLNNEINCEVSNLVERKSAIKKLNNVKSPRVMKSGYHNIRTAEN